MPEEIEANSDPAKAVPAKKSRKLIIAVLAVVVLMAAGAGGMYFWRFRAASKPPAKETAGKKDAGDHGKTDPDTDQEANVTQVIDLQPFIVNLADKNESRYLRMTISLGVAESGEVKADALYTTKIRNAILATISTRTSDQILTVEGKTALRKEMLTAARAAASKPEVLTIYITDFIIQM